MAKEKKLPAVQNARTGSYTVLTHRSALTGRFVAESSKGTIKVGPKPKKSK